MKACPNQREINTHIIKTKVELVRHYNQLSASGNNVTAEMVRNAYKSKESNQRTLVLIANEKIIPTACNVWLREVPEPIPYLFAGAGI